MNTFANKRFFNLIKRIIVFDSTKIKEALLELESYAKNYHCLGYIRYEVRRVFLGKHFISNKPLLYFEIYKSIKPYTTTKATSFIDISLASNINFKDYLADIKAIRDEISLGNTYELNYSIDFSLSCGFKSLSKANLKKLFNYLLNFQKTKYCAFIYNEFEAILSFSPELFFRKINNRIITKPMKGTIERGSNPKLDRENKLLLQNDIKNRAENVMIVDLLRNDLSKISSLVKTTKLFHIESYASVYQMTSQVESRLRDNINLYDIFEALFPCGSISGAPKISTMELISKLERHERGVYCGAIGYLNKDEIIFSVPIRILQVRDDNISYKSGGAIVWDSNAKDEWEEAHLKARFLSLRLLETLRVENGEILFLQEHLKRLESSAKALRFHLPKIIIKPKKKNYIIRILLDKLGNYALQELPFIPHSSNIITISNITTNSNNKLLYHKSTFRPWYEESMDRIKRGEIYDEIFFNQKGELTEGARSNIILEIDKQLFTPSLECGLLNGILRQQMLDNKKIVEKKLYKSDLNKASRIFCINSVRGMVEVRLNKD